MNGNILEKIKDKILDNKDEILETIERGKEYIVAEMDSEKVLGDIVDQANSIYETQICNLLNEKELERLLKIDQAIKRIEEGVYGICVICGREIEEKRLLAIPETNKCVVCKSTEETRKL